MNHILHALQRLFHRWDSGRYTYQRDVGCLCPTCCAKRMQAIDKSYKWY